MKGCSGDKSLTALIKALHSRGRASCCRSWEGVGPDGPHSVLRHASYETSTNTPPDILIIRSVWEGCCILDIPPPHPWGGEAPNKLQLAQLVAWLASRRLRGRN